MAKYRCSNCGTIVDETQDKCHECGALFIDEEQTKSIAKSVFSALTGSRKMEDIKDDWIYEVRRGIVGGMQKTFGVDGDGTDRFKEDKSHQHNGEVIDVDFEVVEEDGTLKKQPKGKMSKNVQDILKKRMKKQEDDEPQDS